MEDNRFSYLNKIGQHDNYVANRDLKLSYFEYDELWNFIEGLQEEIENLNEAILEKEKELEAQSLEQQKELCESIISHINEVKKDL